MGTSTTPNQNPKKDTALVSPTLNISKDIPSGKKISAYVAQQANNSSVLAEVLEIVKDGKAINAKKEVVSIPKDSYKLDQLEMLFYLTHCIKPVLTSETGFQYGLTASAFLCAHALNDMSGGHVPIQNQALTIHDGIGAYTLERLRMENYQIMEHEPSIVLPEMLLQRLAPDLGLAYINGDDQYDEAMLEFYYYDRQTLPNGVIAINTHKSKGRKDLLKFIKKYRAGYSVVETDCGIALVQRSVTPHTPYTTPHA